MLINEIVNLKEDYHTELLTAVQDLLARIIAKDIAELPTEKFKALLAKQGYVASTDEIIQAVSQSGFASSVNADKIIPNDHLPDDMKDNEEPPVDVGNIAGDQAMKDINSEL